LLIRARAKNPVLHPVPLRAALSTMLKTGLIIATCMVSGRRQPGNPFIWRALVCGVRKSTVGMGRWGVGRNPVKPSETLAKP
jgi:hypothetical protein